ncbi:MAG: rhodanese-like domain-containing protein [Sphingobacteriales bacterium]|nr:rhodanese-like domain-containing protein [Sphingobacteriales bacterium]
MAAQPCVAQEELKRLLLQQDKSFLVVDVRSSDEFMGEHIPGAINIPVTELERSFELLSNDSFIITVCGKGGGRSAQAADLLKQKGFQSGWLCGGITGWLSFQGYML